MADWIMAAGSWRVAAEQVDSWLWSGVLCCMGRSYGIGVKFAASFRETAGIVDFFSRISPTKWIYLYHASWVNHNL